MGTFSDFFLLLAFYRLLKILFKIESGILEIESGILDVSPSIVGTWSPVFQVGAIITNK